MSYLQYVPVSNEKWTGTLERGGAGGGFAPLALYQGGQGGQKCPFINYSCLKMSKR